MEIQASAVIHGKITGREPVDYVLKAGKGLYMNVSMATDNGANYFNILAPGENGIAIFNGSSAENQYEGLLPKSGSPECAAENKYEGLLPKSGDYKIRVYMIRSAARRNEVANYRLEMIITAGVDKSPTAEASTPETMMAQCRVRAGEVMTTRLPNIETKYEGQRTDGTHAVNGTAFIDGDTKTFQCSFNRPGRKIVRFVIKNHQLSWWFDGEPLKAVSKDSATFGMGLWDH